MIAVVFEVWIRDSKSRDAYLDIAKSIAHHLQEIDGFLSVERFQSVVDPDKMLSLSFWRDEEAVARWRAFEAHREAQLTARESLFRDYRVRIGQVVRDYGMRR